MYTNHRITDGMDLINRIENRETTYALVYGEFKSVDSITDKFLNGTFSYVDEIKVDNRGEKEIRESNKKYSNDYSMNGITINGINFDKIEPEKFRIITDVRNSKVTYEYYVKKESYTGTLLCYLDQGEIGIIDFYRNQTIPSVRDIYNNEVVFTEHTFLVLWGLFLILILIGVDNLDENPDDFKVNVRGK